MTFLLFRLIWFPLFIDFLRSWLHRRCIDVVRTQCGNACAFLVQFACEARARVCNNINSNTIVTNISTNLSHKQLEQCKQISPHWFWSDFLSIRETFADEGYDLRYLRAAYCTGNRKVVVALFAQQTKIWNKLRRCSSPTEKSIRHFLVQFTNSSLWFEYEERCLWSSTEYLTSKPNQRQADNE